MTEDSNTTPPFWESSRNRKIMWAILIGSCLVTTIAEFFAHAEHHFHFMEFIFSSAVLGFVMCSAMIIVAKGMGMLLKRKPNYYNEDERV